MAQFRNQAQLSYNNTVVNSNVAIGELLEVLSATKTAVTDTYGNGDRVTYVLSIVNSGNTPINGASVSDDLGGYTFGTDTVYPLTYIEGSARGFVNGTPVTPDPTAAAGTPTVFSGIDIPANSNYILIYEVDTNGFAPPVTGGTVTNTATVSAPGITPFSAAETINASNEPELTITKSIDPIPVTENGTVTYTFNIENFGNTEADAGSLASVTDTFDPILTNITPSLDGRALTPDTEYTYDETTGIFATTPGTITVPGATFTQDPNTGEWITTPGTTTLTVTGTI